MILKRKNYEKGRAEYFTSQRQSYKRKNKVDNKFALFNSVCNVKIKVECVKISANVNMG